MPDQQIPVSPFARSASRPVAPVQRTNYGLPPRPAAAQPVARPSVPQQSMVQQTTMPPRTMDVMPPRPQPARPVQEPTFTAAPATAQPTPVAAAPLQPQTILPTPQTPVTPPSAVTYVQPSQPTTPKQPLFTNAPQPSAPPKPSKLHRHVPKLRITLLIIATLLAITGAGRFVTAGSTAGQIIAVGAVAKNDGDSMTIQFTANDGLMHRFTATSNAAYIPGTAVQVAYRAGAPDKTVQQVAVVQGGRTLGVRLILGAAIVYFLAGVATMFMRRQRAKRQSHMPVPVSA